MRKTIVVTFIAVIVGFHLICFAQPPKLFVGLYVNQKFFGDVSTLSGEIVYNHVSIRSWKVTDFNRSTAKIEVELEVIKVQGIIPEEVNKTYNPFPSANYTKTYEFDLNRSYWSYYLNETSSDLMKYKVGETVVESNFGPVKCHHLKLSRPKQIWDAFYDKCSGILINLKETLFYSNYKTTYGFNLTDTNADLNIGTLEGNSNHEKLLIVVSIVAASGAISILLLYMSKRKEMAK